MREIAASSLVGVDSGDEVLFQDFEDVWRNVDRRGSASVGRRIRFFGKIHQRADSPAFELPLIPGLPANHAGDLASGIVTPDGLIWYSGRGG